MRKLIKDFIDCFCIKVREDEDVAFVELMMDDHKCIVWDGQAYYIPENHSIYSDDDTLIYEFLTSCYLYK